MYQREDSKGNRSLVFTLGTGLPLWVQLVKPVSDFKRLVAAADVLKSRIKRLRKSYTKKSKSFGS